MRGVNRIMLIVVCLLVAAQVSADIEKVFNFSEFTLPFIQTETKIETREDVVGYGFITEAVFNERKIDFIVSSKPIAIGAKYNNLCSVIRSAQLYIGEGYLLCADDT